MGNIITGVLSTFFWLGVFWALLALLSWRWRLFGHLFRAYNRSLVLIFHLAVWIVQFPFKNRMRESPRHSAPPNDFNIWR